MPFLFQRRDDGFDGSDSKRRRLQQAQIRFREYPRFPSNTACIVLCDLCLLSLWLERGNFLLLLAYILDLDLLTFIALEFILTIRRFVKNNR